MSDIMKIIFQYCRLESIYFMFTAYSVANGLKQNNSYGYYVLKYHPYAADMDVKSMLRLMMKLAQWPPS